MLAGWQQEIMLIKRVSHSEAMLAGHQQNSCTFTGFSVQRLYWQAIRNHVNLQDFPFRGYAGRLSVRNHVNLQDSLSRGDADIYQRESCELVVIPHQRPC